MIPKNQLMIIMIIILTIFFSGCPGGKTRKTDTIKEQVSSMTLQEKIGQMVIAGFEGYEIDDNVRQIIQEYYIGGVILFRRNVKNADQLLSLVNYLKQTNSVNKAPIFISADEEGGEVSRMPDEIKKLPTNKTIGEINNNELPYEIGNILGEELKTFGLNMDFAPVLDINSNPQNPVIGDRSFGDNPEIVSRIGIKTMKGIRDAGVISVVKHFPGHGDTSVDSHVGLPSVNHDMDRLMNFELIPFIEAIKEEADAVMVAHIQMEKIDSDNPASLSKSVITGLLRERLGFNGVIITDDLTMAAVINHYSIRDAAIKAVNAGSDIILVCHEHNNLIEVINGIKEAVKNGAISKSRIDESVYRILKLKQRFGLKDDWIDSIDIEKINHKINHLNTYWTQ